MTGPQAGFLWQRLRPLNKPHFFALTGLQTGAQGAGAHATGAQAGLGMQSLGMQSLGAFITHSLGFGAQTGAGAQTATVVTHLGAGAQALVLGPQSPETLIIAISNAGCIESFPSTIPRSVKSTKHQVIPTG